MAEHRSFCRVCINNCPILVDVVDRRVVSVRGDRSHPVYEGYTCVKGRAQGELHKREVALRQAS